MLRFQTRPDGVFLAILHDALGCFTDDMSVVIEDAKSDPTSWRNTYPYPDLARLFSPELAKDTVSKLLEASRAPDLYQLTDYHWLLVYVALEIQIDVHNDDARENPPGLIQVGPYQIGRIDKDAIVGRFFWDTDFAGGKAFADMAGEAAVQNQR